jgi:hypothetical protein
LTPLAQDRQETSQQRHCADGESCIKFRRRDWRDLVDDYLVTASDYAVVTLVNNRRTLRAVVGIASCPRDRRRSVIDVRELGQRNRRPQHGHESEQTERSSLHHLEGPPVHVLSRTPLRVRNLMRRQYSRSVRGGERFDVM